MISRRFENTFFTRRQVEVLRLYYDRKLSIDRIAKELNASKADVATILRKARDIVVKARNTLELYLEIVRRVCIDIEPRTSLDRVVDMIFFEADIHGIKLKYTRDRVLLYLIRNARKCIDLDKEATVCRMRVCITYDGGLEL